MEDNNNGKGWLQFNGRLSIRDLLLVLSFLGIGGHGAYTITSNNHMQSEISRLNSELRECKERTSELEQLTQKHDRQIKDNQKKMLRPEIVIRHYDQPGN